MKATGLIVMLCGVCGAFSLCLAANSGGIDAETRSITLAISQEPRSLNSLTAESVSYTAQLLVHLQEGLMRYDGRRQLVGGVARRWQISATEMRFWLRGRSPPLPSPNS